MLDIKFIRENSDIVKKACSLKNINLDIDGLLVIDRELAALKTQEQELLTQKNQLTAKIPKASAEERPKLIAESKSIDERAKSLKPMAEEFEAKLKDLLYLVPQIPSAKAPIGKDDSDNIEIKNMEHFQLLILLHLIMFKF